MTELMGDTLTASLTTEPIEQAADTSGQALLRRVRAGRDEDVDRLVFDVDGPVPDVGVQYVPELTGDGSRNPIPLRSRAGVQILGTGGIGLIGAIRRTGSTSSTQEEP